MLYRTLPALYRTLPALFQELPVLFHKLPVAAIAIVVCGLSADRAIAQNSEIRQLDDAIAESFPLAARLRVFESIGDERVQRIESVRECRRLVGAEHSAEFVEHVDFDNEALVLVFWDLSGDLPENWQVIYQVNDDRITFQFRRKDGARSTPVNLYTPGLTAFVVPKGLDINDRLSR